ncbi:hypothetical protein OSTOST_18357, partial [Ostertagia ostertagi]
MKELKMMMQRGKAVYPPEDPEFAKQFMTIVEFYLLNENNLWRITDETAINKVVEEVLAKNEKLLEKASAGHARSLTRLRNLVVDSSKKRIDVQQAENAVMASLTKMKDPS